MHLMQSKLRGAKSIEDDWGSNQNQIKLLRGLPRGARVHCEILSRPKGQPVGQGERKDGGSYQVGWCLASWLQYRRPWPAVLSLSSGCPPSSPPQMPSPTTRQIKVTCKLQNVTKRIWRIWPYQEFSKEPYDKLIREERKTFNKAQLKSAGRYFGAE